MTLLEHARACTTTKYRVLRKVLTIGLYVDNLQIDCRSLVMKHVQRRHFFIRDMVESFELEVPFVRTADNIADMFTKPMKSATEFHRLRRLVMNEL